MTYFKWSPGMSVGLAKLDEDHKGLIALVNQLAEMVSPDTDEEDIRQETTPDPLELKAIFNALVRYAEVHFAREEKVLEALNYPQLDSHRGGHNGFIQDIQAMRDSFTESHSHARMALVDYLKDWLKFHILIEDQAYRPYIEDAPEIAEEADCFDALDLWEPHHPELS